MSTEMRTDSVVQAEPQGTEADRTQNSLTAREQYRRALMENQKDRDTSVEEFFRTRRNDLRLVDRDAHLKHLQDIDQMCRYLNGDQYGDYDEAGVYQPFTLQDGDFAYTVPVINGHVDQAFMLLMKTQLGYEFSPANRTDPNAALVAKMAEELAIAEKDRLLTEDMLSEEILNSIIAGESYRVLLWAIDPDNPKTVKRLKFVSEEVVLKGSRQCRACGEEVGPDDKACPHCGATFIVELPEGRTIKLTSQEVSAPVAQNVLHIPHMMAVKRNLSALKFRNSSFVIETDYLPKHKAQWDYQLLIQGGAGGLSEELRMRQELERSSGQLDAIVGSARAGGGGGGGVASTLLGQGADNIQRDQIYLDPSEYGWFYVREEVTLPDGTAGGFKLKKGFLGDQCPDGVYVTFLGETLARFKPRNRNRVWSIVLYGKRAGSAKGAGLQILIPLQDIVNDTFNLDYSILMTVGQPLTVVSRQAVKELPEAGQFLFVDKLPNGMRGVEGAVARFPGQSGSGLIGATAERIEGAMQFIGGTASLQGRVGAPDQRAMGTATGIAAVMENQSGRMIGPIKQRIAADKEFMYQLLENIRDYSVDEQREELIKRFGPDTCEEFFKCNFRQALKISIAGNTDLPRSMALTQANAMALAQVAQGLSQVPWGGELVATIADLLGVPFNVGQGRNDRREAEYRLNKLCAIEDRVGARSPELLSDSSEGGRFLFSKLEEFCGPQSLSGIHDEDGRAAFIFMQDHTAFMDVYKDWLFGEDAKTSSDALKLAVIQLWMEHKKAELVLEEQKAQWTQELAQALNPQPATPDPAEIEAARNDADERQAGAALLGHQLAEQSKDADAQRQMNLKEHEAALDQRAQDANLERRIVEQQQASLNQGQNGGAQQS